MRVSEIKRRLEAAEYSIDADAVAGAILRRPAVAHLLLADLQRRGERRHGQRWRSRPGS